MNSVLNNTYSFLVNNDFINYVMNPNHLLAQMWDDFFKSNPSLISVAEEARNILTGQEILSLPAENDALSIKNNILNIISNS